MSKRSEGQIVTQAPIKAVFGGKEYEIKPLVIKESREWRASVSKMLGLLPQHLNATTDNPEAFQDSINTMLVAMPDKVIDLVFAYAKELSRDEIEKVATDAEMAKVFEDIVEVAFPLVQSIGGAVTKLSQ